MSALLKTVSPLPVESPASQARAVIKTDAGRTAKLSLDHVTSAERIAGRVLTPAAANTAPAGQHLGRHAAAPPAVISLSHW